MIDVLSAIRIELNRLDATSNGGIFARVEGNLVRFADNGGSFCLADPKITLDTLRELPEGTPYDDVWAAILPLELTEGD